MKLFRVRIRTSHYSDVAPGDEGILVRKASDGFEVKLTGFFCDAFHKRRLTSRSLWFKESELENLPDEMRQESSIPVKEILAGPKTPLKKRPARKKRKRSSNKTRKAKP